MTKREIILSKAIELLTDNPDGLRYSELVKKTKELCPDIPINTIHGTLWNIDIRLPKRVIKPARGIFKLSVNEQTETSPTTATTVTFEPTAKIKEEDFYESFADWIVKELEECTKAIPLGGNRFKDKWGTPDVIGIREPRQSDIVKLPTEIISVEIKTDTNNLITAFGQACAYKLFSHKSYIVIPNSSSEEDIARIDGLSLIFGVGLILFNNTNPEQPDFEIRTRATKIDPDMFYVNKYMKLIEDELFS